MRTEYELGEKKINRKYIALEGENSREISVTFPIEVANGKRANNAQRNPCKFIKLVLDSENRGTLYASRDGQANNTEFGA